MTTIWDPLRHKDVALTPEEAVRQWCIGVLRDTLGVPESLMRSEVELRYGASAKVYRADILIYERGSVQPLCVVECKRPDIPLSPEVLEQALRYDMVLAVRYIWITNGQQTRVARRDPNGEVVWLDHAPTYNEMIEK